MDQFYLYFRDRSPVPDDLLIYQSDNLASVLAFLSDWKKKRTLPAPDSDFYIRVGSPSSVQTLDIASAKFFVAQQADLSRRTLAAVMGSGVYRSLADDNRDRGSGQRGRPKGFTGIW